MVNQNQKLHLQSKLWCVCFIIKAVFNIPTNVFTQKSTFTIRSLENFQIISYNKLEMYLK